MAGLPHRVSPVPGLLLLCLLAPRFSPWSPLAAAELELVNATSSVPSMNETEDSPLTCHGFQCAGERCYQDPAYANDTVACHNASFCELHRVTSVNYTARCSSACGGLNGTEMCAANGSVRASPCTLECCSSPLCLQLNATAYGDLPPTTTPAPTTTTTTTTKAPPRNGKVCATFSCRGDGCFKGKKPAGRCIVGFDFCEMKKTGSSYVAGCSKACKTGKPVCTGGVATTCYQECCPAGPKASCLKLDGHVHVNGAGRRALAPILQLLAGGAVLVLHYCVLAALQG